MNAIYPISAVLCLASISLIFLSGVTRNAIYGDIGTGLFLTTMAILLMAAIKSLSDGVWQ